VVIAETPNAETIRFGPQTNVTERKKYADVFQSILGKQEPQSECANFFDLRDKSFA